MQFVFCILFLISLIPLIKTSLKCFNKFVVILSFQIYERKKWLTPKIMYFISSLILLMATCSSYDSEI